MPLQLHLLSCIDKQHLKLRNSAVTHLHAIAMQVKTQTNTCEATMAAAAVLTHSRGQAAQPGPPIIPTKEPHYIIKGCGLVPDTRCANSIFAASGSSANFCWDLSFIECNWVSGCLMLSVEQVPCFLCAQYLGRK